MSQKIGRRKLKKNHEEALAKMRASVEKERGELARMLESERYVAEGLRQTLREDPLGYFKIHVSRDNRFDGYGRFRDEVMVASVSWNPHLIAYRIRDEHFGEPLNVAREVDPLIVELCNKIRKTIVDVLVNKR